MLLDYPNTYSAATDRFIASGMILRIDSDEVYIVAPKERSKVAGFYYLGDKYSKTQHQSSNLMDPYILNLKH